MGPEEAAPTVEDFLVPEGEQEGEVEQSAEETPLDDLPIEDVADEVENSSDEDSEEVENSEEEEAETEVVPAPSSWSKDDVKAFEALPLEAKQIIARREAERDKYVRETGRKAAETRQTVENEARQVLAQQAENHAVALQVYAQQHLPSPPDQSLLYTGDQNDVLTYHRQDAAYRAAAAQQQTLQQAIVQAQQQAVSARTQAQQVEAQADVQRLQEQLPEWFDPTSGPKLKEDLQSIGSALGYPVELMAEASSVDILALKMAHDWKAKADKFDKLVSKRMETVRAAKGMPKMARPGATPGKGQQAAQATSRRTEAMKTFGHTRSGEDAMALLLERRR